MIIIYSDRILADSLKHTAKLIDDLQMQYDVAGETIAEAVDKFTNLMDRVTLVDAQKHMSPAELQNFKRTIRYYQTDDVSDSWKKELEELENRSRVKKVELVAIAIRHEMDRLKKLESEGLEDLTENTYKYAYYNTLYEISKEIGVTKKYPEVDESKLETLHREPWADDNKNRRTRIDERLSITTAYLLKRFIQTVRTDNIESMYEIINKRIKYNKYRVKGLSVTETVYYNSHAQEDAYDEVGVEEYQNIATLDDLTSDICQEMDLTVFPVSEYEPGVTAPPFHTYCRTTTIAKYDDNFVERFARDGDNIYYVDGDISYKEWFDEYVK